jgi:ribonuclease G
VSRELLIAVSPGEWWAALLDEGELTGLRVLRPGAGGQVGEIHLGRVVALRPDLPAALVDIGLDRPAFLSAEDALPHSGLEALEEGQAIIVQVVKAARADKATGVTMRTRIAGRLVDLLPARRGVSIAKGLAASEQERLAAAVAGAAADHGVALRAAAAAAASDVVAREVEVLRERWRAVVAASAARRAPALLEETASPIAWLLEELAPLDAITIDDRAAFAEARHWLGRHRPALVARLALHRERTPLFEHEGVAGDVAAALAPRIALPDGTSLTIEHGAAVTLIDVDSGSAPGRRGEAGAEALAANLRAAREVARQIRLRNLAGPIVVDFIGMRDRGRRERVRAALAERLGPEGDTEILGWTRLGHLELVRKRRHAPLAELLFERAPGAGLVKTALTVALEALRLVAREAEAAPGRPAILEVAPEVAAALDGAARAARSALEARLGRPLTVKAEPGRARHDVALRFG